jgi:hypothetical protein
MLEKLQQTIYRQIAQVLPRQSNTRSVSALAPDVLTRSPTIRESIPAAKRIVYPVIGIDA